MPFYPCDEPLHTGTDKELVDKLTRECSGLREIAMRVLAALGWKRDIRYLVWWKVVDGEKVSITEACLDMLCDNDEPYQLLGMFRSWKWDREAQIITRAYEDLPTYVRVARHMARHGQR